MERTRHHLRTRLTALLLALVCVLGLFPTTAFAAADTIKLKEFGMSGISSSSSITSSSPSSKSRRSRRARTPLSTSPTRTS